MVKKKIPDTMPANNFIYDAVIEKVVDGDTVAVSVDLGMDTWKHGTKLRLMGINTPEKNTEAGVAAKTFMESLFKPGQPVRIETIKDDTEKYGRYLAKVYHPTLTTSVNDELVAKGFAKPYDGKGVKPV